VRVISEFIFVGAVIMLPLSVQAGFLAKFFNVEEAAIETNIEPAQIEPVDIPLLTTLQNPNPIAARGGAEIIVDENVLVSTGPVGEDEIAEQQSSMGEIRVYTVRVGDSLSQIAEMFDVTTNTIMWANDITKATEIQPGDTLVILPIVGVRHVVKDGDTMSTIAKKYEGDIEEILGYNQLASADELSIGDTLIIPGGAMHSAPARTFATPVKVSGGAAVAATSFSHPAPGSVKTQGIHGYNAVDLAAGYGTSIRAAAAGEVIVSKSSGWNGGYGQYIVIRHSNGTQTLYAHLSSNAVGVGAYVAQGEVIGGMGSTGRSTGVHLHFEVRGARNPF
tara:strand:- start:2758 stop:3759 length:1002 start_codon:yes stop_codon:yes gene_type:complete